MRFNSVAKLLGLQLSMACACLFTQLQDSQAADVHWGNMKANRILFLGNSITLHPPLPSIGWNNNWGMAASTAETDYVHVLTSAIEQKTGATLRIDPTDPAITSPVDGSVLAGHVNDANVVNLWHEFEFRYKTYDNTKFQPQIEWKPDIVVLQFGENIDMATLDAAALKISLQTLLNGLKESSNPHIFLPSFILGVNPTIDAIKQQVVADDPSHRVFVDLSVVGQDSANLGGWRHPNDRGMALIANTLFGAMDAHAIPEPCSGTIVTAGLLAMLARSWRKRKQ